MKREQQVFIEKEAADYVRLTPRALQNYRYKGGGPAFIRISKRCIRYRKSDLDAWLEEHKAFNTAS